MSGTRDGSLRPLVRQKFMDAQWTPVETGLTQSGVPDAHYIFAGGINGWCEFKQTSANAVRIDPFQVSWLSRYSRLGGRCFVAVRQMKADALYLYKVRTPLHSRKAALMARCRSVCGAGGRPSGIGMR